MMAVFLFDSLKSLSAEFWTNGRGTRDVLLINSKVHNYSLDVRK